MMLRAVYDGASGRGRRLARRGTAEPVSVILFFGPRLLAGQLLSTASTFMVSGKSILESVASFRPCPERFTNQTWTGWLVCDRKRTIKCCGWESEND